MVHSDGNSSGNILDILGGYSKDALKFLTLNNFIRKAEMFRIYYHVGYMTSMKDCNCFF